MVLDTTTLIIPKKYNKMLTIVCVLNDIKRKDYLKQKLYDPLEEDYKQIEKIKFK